MMVITNPQLEEKAQNDLIDFIKTYIHQNKGEIVLAERWGKRGIAYQIKRFLEAYYDVLYFRIEPKHLPEFERRLKLKEDIVRYMIIKVDKTQEEKIKIKAMAYANKEKAEAASAASSEPQASELPEKTEPAINATEGTNE
jgi:small subunit ribosomal protein S6